MENDVDGVADEVPTAVIYEHHMKNSITCDFFFFFIERWRKVIYECQRRS